MQLVTKIAPLLAALTASLFVTAGCVDNAGDGSGDRSDSETANQPGEYETLTYENVEAYVEPYGIRLGLFGEGENAPGMIELIIPGDFMDGGEATVELSPDMDGSLSFVDGGELVSYRPFSGSLTVSVTGSDPNEKEFAVTASDLVFELVVWSGQEGGAERATIANLDATGHAIIFRAPAPPEQNLNFDALPDSLAYLEFLSDAELDLVVTDYASNLIIYIPFKLDQLNVPGTTEITMPVDDPFFYGSASIDIGSANGWEFHLRSLTVTTTANEFVPCQPFGLTLSDMVFDYMHWIYDDAGNPVVQPSDIQLRVDSVVASELSWDFGCTAE
ncbi:MAG: hypothetical protein AAGC55_28630 [Myxococcota bacterium]